MPAIKARMVAFGLIAVFSWRLIASVGDATLVRPDLASDSYQDMLTASLEQRLQNSLGDGYRTHVALREHLAPGDEVILLGDGRLGTQRFNRLRFLNEAFKMLLFPTRFKVAVSPIRQRDALERKLHESLVLVKLDEGATVPWENRFYVIATGPGFTMLRYRGDSR